MTARTANLPHRRPTPESGVVKAIQQGFAAHGIECQRLNTGMAKASYGGKRRVVRFGFPGCPDLVAFLPGGLCLWVECKSDTGRLTDEQAAFRDRCHKRGTPWVLARSWDDVSSWVKVRGAA